MTNASKAKGKYQKSHNISYPTQFIQFDLIIQTEAEVKLILMPYGT